jgi:hypothetical protein
VLQEVRELVVKGQAAQLWKPIVGIGGNNGWYYADWLWEARGWLDRLVGGSGLRRGRRDSQSLCVGDAVDFWRVLEIVPEKRLLLSAEMRLPGVALMDLRLTETGEGSTKLTHSVKFLPTGLFGILYWYTVSPLHSLVFPGMLRGIAARAGLEIMRGPVRKRISKPTELNAAFG